MVVARARAKSSPGGKGAIRKRKAGKKILRT